MIHGHGDDTHDFPGRIRANFSSNVWPGVDASALEDHLSRRLGAIRAYPEPDARSLRMKWAEIHDLTPEHFCATNGATEAIYGIAQAWRGAASAIVVPTFSEYEDACRIHGHALSFVAEPREAGRHTDTIWLCDPNNPTGKVHGRQALLEQAAARPRTLFVIDQSYAGFTELPLLDLGEAVRHENIVVIRSMTKRYAIPGLRLGCIAAHPRLVAKIAAGRMPWSVNGLAVEAGLFLSDAPLPGLPLADYLLEARRLQQALAAIGGLDVLPGGTPFFLCRLAAGRAADLKRRLVERHGLLIREASNFRGLDERHFRICTQMPAENDLLTEAIKEWISLH
jgi:threonine-phosphate decarboxylase